MKYSPSRLNCLETKVQFPSSVQAWTPGVTSKSHPRTWRNLSVTKLRAGRGALGKVLKAVWWSHCLLREGGVGSASLASPILTKTGMFREAEAQLGHRLASPAPPGCSQGHFPGILESRGEGAGRARPYSLHSAHRGCAGSPAMPAVCDQSSPISLLSHRQAYHSAMWHHGPNRACTGQQGPG